MRTVGRNPLGWLLVALVVLATAVGSIAAVGSCERACMDKLYQCLADADEAYEQCILTWGPESHDYCLDLWQSKADWCDTKYWNCVNACPGGGGGGPELPTDPMLCPEGEICLPW